MTETELDWYKDVRTQQFVYGLHRTVIYDDPDTNVKLKGLVTDIRITHNIHPNMVEIYADFGSHGYWYSVLFTVISIEQEEV